MARSEMTSGSSETMPAFEKRLPAWRPQKPSRHKDSGEAGIGPRNNLGRELPPRGEEIYRAGIFFSDALSRLCLSGQLRHIILLVSPPVSTCPA